MTNVSRTRVLVWLYQAHTGSEFTCSFRQLSFLESVLSSLAITEDEGETYVALEENQFQLAKLKSSFDPSARVYGPIRIKRPSFCPVHNIPEELKLQISASVQERGVDCGAATLIEAADGRVLLTRRAAHLRTFPGVWVPPGGHIDPNETFFKTALREFEEEVGLRIQQDWCVGGDINILALWESVFPPKLIVGLPQRHHVVVYLHAKLKQPYTSEYLTKQLQLEPGEVDMCCWLDRSLIEAAVTASEEGAGEAQDKPKLPATLQVLRVDSSGQHEAVHESSFVINTATEGNHERISTGTKFALEMWLKQCE